MQLYIVYHSTRQAKESVSRAFRARPLSCANTYFRKTSIVHAVHVHPTIEKDEDGREDQLTFSTSTLTTILYKGSNRKKKRNKHVLRPHKPSPDRATVQTAQHYLHKTAHPIAESAGIPWTSRIAEKNHDTHLPDFRTTFIVHAVHVHPTIEQEEDGREDQIPFSTIALTTTLYKGSNRKKNETNMCSGPTNRVPIEQRSRLHSIVCTKQGTL